jgi:DNA-3-methyladenine glycosylase II
MVVRRSLARGRKAAGDADPINNRALTEAEFVRARRILMRRDPKLGAVMRRVGRCALPDGRTHDPFAGLVRVIMSQQLSGKAAETIFGRVKALADAMGGLTPSALRGLDHAALRSAGVSRPKISYLYDLADHVADGRLEFAALDGLTDEDVIARITAVKGLGRWSAEMFLMFRLNRPDILPVDDLGIVKGMQSLFGMKRRPAPRTMVRLAEPWRPYRSIASWYLWRILEKP